MSTPRMVKVRLGSEHDQIPEMWLAGRVQYWQIHAPHLHLRERYQYAIEDWFEQKRLAELYAKEN